MVSKEKVGEWIHRILGFTIFESFIVCLSFAALHIPLTVLKPEQINFSVRAGLIQASLATAYLQIANVFYWIIDINLFDFKKLWRKKK